MPVDFLYPYFTLRERGESTFPANLAKVADYRATWFNPFPSPLTVAEVALDSILNEAIRMWDAVNWAEEFYLIR